MYWSIDISHQCIDKIKNLSPTSIATYDFTLFTNLPLNTVYEGLEKSIMKLFHSSGYRYIAVNVSNKKSFMTSTKYSSYKIYSLDKILTALKCLLTESYVQFGTQIFQQTKGVPMGSNSSPLIADLFLSWCKFKFMSDIIKNKKLQLGITSLYEQPYMYRFKLLFTF
jgi:hypothetical protein